MYFKRLFVILIFSAISLATPTSSWSVPTAFAWLTNPNGVVVDQAGNVYVQSLSLLGDGGLYKYNSNGVLKARNSQLFGKFRFAQDPMFNNFIWAQEISGKLYVINTETLQEQLFMDLRAWAINNNIQPVLNMLTGQNVNLLMVSPNFGDIAIRQVGTDQLDLFITGLTSDSGGMPFVLRLRLKNQALQSTKIMVASIPLPTPIIPPPLNTYPYGIAVNTSGMVLTALPDNISGGVTPLFLVTFGADFPETGSSPPVFVPGYRNKSAFAIGMTASASNGGFYVSTVANGLGCGAGPAILYFSSNLAQAICVADLSLLGLGNIAPSDVALDPTGQFIYVTMTQNGLVLRLDLPAPPPPDTSVQLGINKLGTGSGTVTSAPPGINCGGDCIENYTSGTVVTLTATANPGSSFAAWSGDADCADGQVSMGVAKACAATFVLTPLAPFMLTVVPSGTGTGVVTSNPEGINCGGDCLEGYATGTVVTLIATPSNGSAFAGWEGACSGTGACQVTLSAASGVSAAFAVSQTPDVNAECLFDWAEKNFPTLFAPSGSPSLVSSTDTYRYYSATNANLRVSTLDKHVYYQGADGKLQDEGPLSDWLPKAACPFSPPPLAECLFVWAEKNYPSLFAPVGYPTTLWNVYAYRYYSGTNAHLGVNSTDNHVYFMGGDGRMQDEGPTSYWLPLAGCQ